MINNGLEVIKMEILQDPGDMEKDNRQTIIKNLNDVYSSVEKLIQQTYLKKKAELNFQLRNLRTAVSQLRSDITNRNLDGFSGRKGTLDDFYRTEDNLLNASAKMKDTFASLITSSDPIDIFLLEALLDNFKKGFNDRIIVDKDMQNEFKLKKIEMSSADRVISNEKQLPDKKDTNVLVHLETEKNKNLFTTNISKSILTSSLDPGKTAGDIPERTDKEEIETNMLSKLYNYMNVLEHKYSTYQPELAFSGEYTGEKRWKFSISDRSISGSIIDVLKPFLTFKTCWHPFNDLRTIMNFVQKDANAVPTGQYKSLCFLNSGWSSDIKEWAQNYVHPRLVLYLYDLGKSEILFNRNVRNADRLMVWHNLDTYVTLEDEIEPLIDQADPFDAAEVAERTGLSIDGAKRLIAIMLSKNKVMDIGFGTSRYAGIKNK
ncbi:hypothetical protein [Methanolobus psychrotolerans]|uniref:hypothetical protein n=1 Tax=Methanolobus psychrotolerans TaxID=1874706 RepID=UPI000B91A098|nr:hypothetical protein [Methanolobus psychrotolerans]